MKSLFVVNFFSFDPSTAIVVKPTTNHEFNTSRNQDLVLLWIYVYSKVKCKPT